MPAAPLPANEIDRLAALRSAGILDTAPELAFDDLTRLAAYICKTPISTITFIDANRQWFKSRVGMTDTETSRDISFCSHAILTDGMMIVPDATRDSRFAGFSNVVDDPLIRFYAGVPLKSREGLALGTLCVIDRQARTLEPEQEGALRALGRQAAMQLELRRALADVTDVMSRVKILSGLVPMCAWCKKLRDDKSYWQSVEEYLAAHSEASVTHGMCPECLERELRDPRR